MRTDPFLFHSGRAAHTVGELLHAIEESPQQVFEEHVRTDRNDFASWIELGLHEETLAGELRKTTDRIQTIIILRNWLKSHPSRQFGFLEKAHQKEFLLGLLFGLILGIILFQLIRVLA
jgi:hypothetical protein